MEIVLAVLLLFGGFTLGSITADEGADGGQSTTGASYVDGSADSSHVPQDRRQQSPIRCDSRSVVYRDLTVHPHSKIGQSTVEDGRCAGDCPNE
ncbi:MAG: hypothetical protein N0E48_17985 [Candidatus Thiodiazotropha endolucinida]|nr:hypothetical protein [Candidatus Thiodiazotropha taylori]MCW4345226.1 hypothetical protein [Candidatus Thiodiazotropha endolucinida]